MASCSMKRLNFRVLQLVFEVFVLLSASYYNHNFSESNYIGNLGRYQQQCDSATKQGPTSAAILGLKAASTFQPKNFRRILELEIFKACDVNPNPGPTTPSKNKNDKTVHLSRVKGLRLGQWNVNNLTDTKFEQIRLLLTTRCQETDVLFLLETFLKPNKPDCVLEVPGYTLFRKDRQGTKKGGGILAYVADKLKVDRITSLEEMDLETVWLQVYPHKSNRPILTGAVYRPPSSKADMDAKLELNIETAYLRNQEMYVFGDFNINFLDTHVY